jgi:hypothetical protein
MLILAASISIITCLQVITAASKLFSDSLTEEQRVCALNRVISSDSFRADSGPYGVAIPESLRPDFDEVMRLAWVGIHNSRRKLDHVKVTVLSDAKLALPRDADSLVVSVRVIIKKRKFRAFYFFLKKNLTFILVDDEGLEVYGLAPEKWENDPEVQRIAAVIQPIVQHVGMSELKRDLNDTFKDDRGLKVYATLLMETVGMKHEEFNVGLNAFLVNSQRISAVKVSSKTSKWHAYIGIANYKLYYCDGETGDKKSFAQGELYIKSPNWPGQLIHCNMIKQSEQYLQTLEAVRTESKLVYEKVQKGSSEQFSVKEEGLGKIAQVIKEMIRDDYGNGINNIQPHGRWRHIPSELLQGLAPSQHIDMLMLSVLLDAGAGDEWIYVSKSGREYCRSEGIAVAVAEAYLIGIFSDNKSSEIDGQRLETFSTEDMNSLFQITASNKMAGTEGRLGLIQRLGTVLCSRPEFASNKRPSGMIDYIKRHVSSNILDIKWFWENIIINALGSIWPGGRSDVYFCELTERKVPFHKLSQWLCVSLVIPLEKLFGFKIGNSQLLTGLAEYRNGGLFIDYGVIVPKHKVIGELEPSDQVIVEWRALTIVLLDKLHADYFPELSLRQLLEAGTWKAGRAIAKEKRPNGAPPIAIKSDGTLF